MIEPKLSTTKAKCKACGKATIHRRNGIPVGKVCTKCRTSEKKSMGKVSLKKHSKKKKPKKKTLTNKLDKLFSLIVRARGKCEVCGATDTLQTSHIYSRANRSVRWDELNAICKCAKCHFWWHQNPADGVEWLKGYYTEDQYIELRKRANEIKQWSVDEMQELIEDLQVKVDNLT